MSIPKKFKIKKGGLWSLIMRKSFLDKKKNEIIQKKKDIIKKNIHEYFLLIDIKNIIDIFL